MTCDDCGPIAADLKRLSDREAFWQGDANHWRREARDLRLHLADRDRYIRDLEEQLRPYLVAPPDQKALEL